MKELSTLLVIKIVVIFFQIVISFYLGWFCHEKKISSLLGHIHWTFKASGFFVIPRKSFPIRRV